MKIAIIVSPLKVKNTNECKHKWMYCIPNDIGSDIDISLKLSARYLQQIRNQAKLIREKDLKTSFLNLVKKI